MIRAAGIEQHTRVAGTARRASSVSSTRPRSTGPGLRHCPDSKTVESVGAQALEIGLLPEHVEGRQGELVRVVGRIRCEDAAGGDRPTVDPHHPADESGMAIEHKAHRRIGSAVRHDDHRLCLGGLSPGHGLLDRRHLVIERSGRPMIAGSGLTDVGDTPPPPVPRDHEYT